MLGNLVLVLKLYTYKHTSIDILALDKSICEMHKCKCECKASKWQNKKI